MSRTPLRLLVVLPLALGPVSALADDPAPPRAKQSSIRILKETTHITEPLDAEGYVDYLAALNERFSKEVTPANNYEVVVRRVMGPGEISETMRAEYFRRLGIEELPAEGDYLVGYVVVADRPPLDEAQRQRMIDEQKRALSSPWTDADLPRVAAWLKNVDGHLDRIVEGSKRSRYYTPYVAGNFEEDWPGPRLQAVLLPSAQQQREIARCLAMRAMYRLGNGNVDDAWSDLQALRRGARHVASGATLIEGLVGIAMNSIAFDAESVVLRSPKLTDARAKQCLADLRAMPPLPPMVEKLDVVERWTGLDATQAVARRGTGSLPEVMKTFKLINVLSHVDDPAASPFATYVGADDEPAPPAGPPVEFTPDWNVALVLVNDWYDRLAATARIADVAQRREQLAALKEDLKKLKAEFGNPATFFAKHLLGKEAREAAGTAIGNLLVSVVLPALNYATVAEDRDTAKAEVLRLGFAAEVFRRETGRLPSSLADLAPKYVPSIPADPMTGDPLVFRSANGRLLIHSVGRNLVDDGGVGEMDRPKEDRKSDDIAVRLVPR